MTKKNKSNLKNNLKKQGMYSYKNKDNKGSNWVNYLDLSACNLEKFKEKDNTDYVINIIPYEILSDKHPNKKKGENAYNMEIFVHKGVGARKHNHICMNHTFGKRCATCEEKQRLLDAGYEWNDVVHLKPKCRNVYIIEHKGALYIYDTSFKLFEELWLARVSKLEKKGKDVFPIYSDEDDCTSLEFSTNDKSGIGRYTDFEFPEIEDYDESLLDKVNFSLEDLIIIPDQNELKQLFDDEEDDEPEEESKNQDYYDEVTENEEDINDEEEDEPEEEVIVEPVKKKKKKKKKDECPNGFKFGEEWDEYENCDQCQKDNEELYNRCKANS